MKYVRRAPYIDALVFTPELGQLTERAGKLVVAADAAKAGITYEEGKGYSYRGAALRFGDYMVLTPGVKPVWSASDFVAQFKKKGE